MKKILYITMVALTLLMSSCSMEREPQGAISDADALTTVKDYKNFFVGLNAMMRSVTSGDYVILSDIQLDDFNAIIGNGNRRMEFYNGQVTPGTGEIGAIYSGYYSAIAQANFLIQNAQNKLKDNSLLPVDKDNLSYYLASAYFFRAYCYSCLADKFCQSYINCAERESEGTGLSLQLEYAPTAENQKYPGRSSLVKTYQQILDDLDAAAKLMTDASENIEDKINYPSIDAVNALTARVYLNMGMYNEAAATAQVLIDSPKYPLIMNKRNFHDMWFKDEGSEIIWKVTGDVTYHGSATGSAFCSNEQNPDYIPNNDAIYLFDENDHRWYAWFENDITENTVAKTKAITNSGGTATMYLFAKYPGNPALQTAGASGSNFVNMSKPLRIGEMYLIVAEANAELGNEEVAKKYLSKIESARQAGGYKSSLTGSDLKAEIRNERHRELMGEGLRQADLKRWNMGCERSEAFDGYNDVVIKNYLTLQYQPADYRLTWPIPQHEIDTNPQVAKQQNPGY